MVNYYYQLLTWVSYVRSIISLYETLLSVVPPFPYHSIPVRIFMTISYFINTLNTETSQSYVVNIVMFMQIVYLKY